MKFIRRDWSRYSKLGKKRKKKITWRSPKGRDNKMREKRKGYPAAVNIGYKKNKKRTERIIIKNLNDLNKVEKKIVILGRIGKKKKIEILKRAKEMKIKIDNVNIEKFLEKNSKIEEKILENKK